MEGFRMFEAARGRLQTEGIYSQPLNMILYGMAEFGEDYDYVLAAYAEMQHTAREQMQARCCEHILRAGLEEQPRNLLTRFREELRG